MNMSICLHGPFEAQIYPVPTPGVADTTAVWLKEPGQSWVAATLFFPTKEGAQAVADAINAAFPEADETPGGVMNTNHPNRAQRETHPDILVAQAKAAGATLEPRQNMALTATQRDVDELGILKAEMAKLAEREAELKARLVNANVETVDGELFHASISHSERTVRDADFKEQIEELIIENFTPQYRRAHTSMTKIVTVRVTARSAAAAAAANRGRR